MVNLSKLSKVVAAAALLSVAQLGYAQQKLTILWAQWDPANYLQELVKDYEKASGVKVVVETTPWPDFQNKAFKEFTAKGAAYDMVVGDSQWIGAGSTGGHYVDLSDFFKKNKLTEVMAPATVKGYAEYPGNSGKYWAVPLEGDANGFAYRKDWFEDPKEMAAFKAKYKYDLAVPKTWKELGDIAEFFHRPKQKRYGLTIYTDNSYDALVMGAMNTIFSYGGELGDYSTYKVQGLVNSKESIEALNFYKKLYGYTPPDWGKTFFQEANQAMTEGLVAMSMNYFAFFPALANPATNKFAKQTGYFAMPKGPSGKQFAALGGQGISVVSYSDKQDAALQYIKWFAQPDVQAKWWELGGYSCLKAVVSAPGFAASQPYAQTFLDSMAIVKDFWAEPSYASLLQASQKRLHDYVVAGTGTPKEALDLLVKDWTEVFQDDGKL